MLKYCGSNEVEGCRLVFSFKEIFLFKKYYQKINLEHTEQGVLDGNHNFIRFTTIYEPCPKLTKGIVFGRIVMKVAEMVEYYTLTKRVGMPCLCLLAFCIYFLYSLLLLATSGFTITMFNECYMYMMYTHTQILSTLKY